MPMRSSSSACVVYSSASAQYWDGCCAISNASCPELRTNGRHNCASGLSGPGAFAANVQRTRTSSTHCMRLKLNALGKARQPYEFGVKVSLAITEKQGLIVGARAFPGNPYDGHTLAEQLEQSSILLQDLPGTPQPKTILVDLGFRGVDVEVSSVHLIHRGKHKTLTSTQRRWLKRRQAIEPIIGHVKHDHGMRRCWLKGQTGDALHAVLCATGYNLRWLLRAIVRLGLGPIFFILAWLHWIVNVPSHPLLAHRERFRRPNLPAPTKCPTGVVRQAN